MQTKLTNSIGLFFLNLELFAKERFGEKNFKLLSFNKKKNVPRADFLVKDIDEIKTVIFDRNTEEFKVENSSEEGEL